MFWRSAISGGRFTAGKRLGEKNRTQSGDICAVGEQGHVLTDKFSIECKHVKNLNFDCVLFGGTGSLARFWRQAQRDAGSARKRPILIARQNLMPVMVVSTIPVLVELVPSRLIRIQFYVGNDLLGIVKLEDLLRSPCQLATAS